MSRASALLLPFALATTGCFTPIQQIDLRDPHPGTFERDLTFDKLGRTYTVHLPVEYTPEKKMPLVVMLHGAWANAEWTEDLTAFSDIGEREGFIVVYPNAYAEPAGTFRLWNAGRCCGKQVHDKVDDLGFVGAVLDDASEILGVDRERVYMAGYSNGGSLAFLAGARYTKKLAAVGVFAGNMTGTGSLELPEFDSPPPNGPISVLEIQGADDEHMPYRGKQHGDYVEIPFLTTEDFWAKADGCTYPPESRDSFSGAVIERDFTKCDGGAEVSFMTVAHWKHEWAGGTTMKKLDADNPLKHFDAAEMMWAFFAKHHRPNPAVEAVTPAGKLTTSSGR